MTELEFQSEMFRMKSFRRKLLKRTQGYRPEKRTWFESFLYFLRYGRWIQVKWVKIEGEG
jgi:hypothetical protein